MRWVQSGDFNYELVIGILFSIVIWGCIYRIICVLI